MSKLDLALLLVGVVCLTVVAVRYFAGSKPSAVVSGRSLELGALIDSVRNDLARADSARIAGKRESLFKVKTFDLEVNFVVSRQTSGTAGADFQVVTLEGAESYSDETIQKIVLHMEAIEDTVTTHEILKPETP